MTTAPDLPQLQLARSIHCFRATDPPRPPQPRARAKLSQQEKQKVREVRRQGACLRCRVLKIQCSNQNPCQPCLQSAVKGSERKVLSFCYCVRTRFADVNIFQSAWAETPTMQLETVMARMGGLLARIATPANFSLHSDTIVFNETLVSWLTNPQFNLPNGSIVGLCCSNLLSLQFQDETVSGDNLATEFRRFLLATSLVHSGWRGDKDVTQRDLCAAGHISGYRLMKQLDRVLTPQFLAKCGRDSCQVLFLLVLGVVLGVGYSSQNLTDSPSFPTQLLGAEFQKSPTLWLAMKEHLCQMLAHHLIFLGSLLGIKLDTGLERRIIDTAISRWNKMEAFVWADATGLNHQYQHQHQQPQPLPSPPPLRQLSMPSVPIRSGKDAEVVPMKVAEDDQNPPYWEDPPPPPAATAASASHAPLIPIPFPEVAQFRLDHFDQWCENPRSYLDMETEEPKIMYTEPSLPEQRIRIMGPVPRANTEPVLRQDEHAPRKDVRRRSMWVVRSFDAGPEHGHINVHARLRDRREVGSFGVFV
ncbi:hypothetical protein B0H63DRAFT_30521 [Podospora didyma]|uniref:Zn(2)-C6 fungal-type domain-containing protein n=1 Tax=Podospora didyma TaxID=330526 RepID=A0AAE0U824_9PEZI|nr:hypothetical protein B0H63DRAFT_30521 [Podospora didyma]